MSNSMEVIAQDAYDADQYRGVIGASKQSRIKQKELSAEAIARIKKLIEAVDTFTSTAHHVEDFNAMQDALTKVQEEVA